jgi:hypothetical protein
MNRRKRAFNEASHPWFSGREATVPQTRQKLRLRGQ